MRLLPILLNPLSVVHTNQGRHFFGSRNMGASGARIKGAVSIVQELARQAGLEVPGTGEEYAFLAKADLW